MKIESKNEFWKERTVNLPVNLLFATVSRCHRRGFYDKVKESIQKEGLINPLLVVRATPDRINEYISKLDRHKDLLALPDRHFEYFIFGGSNRYYAINELGYTSIDCVIFDSFQEAFDNQPLQRNDFK